MGAEEPDRDDAGFVFDDSNQAIVVGLDVEHDPARLEDARFRVRCLDVPRSTPSAALRDREPCLILRARHPDSLVIGVLGEISLRKADAHDKHSNRIADNSKKWKENSRIWKFRMRKLISLDARDMGATLQPHHAHEVAD